MISTEEILRKITREDMPNESMRGIWDDFGKEVAVKLLVDYAGIPVTPPKRGLTRFSSRMIKEEFDGTNMNEMVRRFNVSMSHVYTIAREEGSPE